MKGAEGRQLAALDVNKMSAQIEQIYLNYAGIKLQIVSLSAQFKSPLLSHMID